MKVLVTGAGGKTGRAVIAALVKQGATVRPFLHRPQVIPGTLAPVIGDMGDSALWAQSLVGMDKVYHICPNMHPDEVAIGEMALSAAKTAAVDHFVYHSVLHPQTEAMPHHWHKLRVEEMLVASGLPFTILQPTAYMQNLRANLTAVVEQGVLALPYPVTSRISLVDLQDVAAVVTRVLTEPGHAGATYQLVGTLPLPPVVVAQQLADIFQRPVRAQEIGLEDWQETAVQAGLSSFAIETLLAMFRYYATCGLVGNPTVLRHLLGREPTSLGKCVARWR